MYGGILFPRKGNELNVKTEWVNSEPLNAGYDYDILYDSYQG